MCFGSQVTVSVDFDTYNPLITIQHSTNSPQHARFPF
jgi:hypothetical protein